MKKIIILGGGLWGGLLAASLQKKIPDLDFTLIESGSTFGGNHTWSFHATDVDDKQTEFISPFVSNRWDRYDVAFPEYSKTVEIPYRTISSSHFHKVLSEILPVTKFKLNKRMSLDEALAQAEIVFDCRGMPIKSESGYQKFVGRKVKLKKPHNLKHPVLMDATVQQIDGFRFMYVLPIDDQTLLVEDTRYSQDSSLDHFRIREKINSYLNEKGWEIDGLVGEESGILPIPFNYHPPKDENHVSLQNIFHDVTGYSLPDAVRMALLFSESDVDLNSYKAVIRNYTKRYKQQREFFCLLNKLMFQVSQDEERYKMLSFFYRKKTSQISHFYAQKLNSLDRLMFFVGTPPVSLKAAARFFISNRPFSGSAYYESNV